jgi:DNA-directed RNA polymerase subunit RPC12/RpoP
MIERQQITPEEIERIAARVAAEESTFIDHEIRCTECGGTLSPLGTLGTLNHYRCEDCGLNHAEEAIELPTLGEF